MPAPRISVLFIVLVFSTGLVACGKTGVLYLPKDMHEKSAVQVTEKEPGELPGASPEASPGDLPENLPGN